MKILIATWFFFLERVTLILCTIFREVIELLGMTKSTFKRWNRGVFGEGENFGHWKRLIWSLSPPQKVKFHRIMVMMRHVSLPPCFEFYFLIIRFFSGMFSFIFTRCKTQMKLVVNPSQNGMRILPFVKPPIKAATFNNSQQFHRKLWLFVISTYL